MIGYFPEPYPDELFYSLCARFGERMQFPSKSAVTRDLLGKSTATAVVDLPRYLEHFVDALPPGHACKSVDRLINDHTLLPFYGPFQPVNRLRRVREDMLSDNGASPYMRSGLSPTLIRRPTWLRFCPVCVDDDREHFGECYWHRVHQVPGVEICPTHQVSLENSGAYAQNDKTRYEFLAAENVVGSTTGHPPHSLQFHQPLLDLARDAVWLLAQDDLTVGPNLLHERYKLALLDQGFAGENGIVKRSRLMQSFKAYYPPELLLLLHCDLDEQIRDNWLVRLVGSRNAFRHPLRHLLLIHFLGYTMQTFLQLPTERLPFGSGPWPCLNRASPHYGELMIHECQVVYDREGRFRGTFACVCGFVYSRRGPDRSDEDMFRVAQYRSFGPAWEEKLKTLWVDPSMNPYQISIQLGVDRSTITRQASRLGLPFPPPGAVIQKNSRMLSASQHSTGLAVSASTLNEHREQWLSILRDHPEAGRMALQSGWPTLRRWFRLHDVQWLNEHLPPRRAPVKTRTKLPPPRVNWAERDEQIADQVRAAAHRLREIPGRPMRMTARAIRREMEPTVSFLASLDKLPLTSEALAELVETYEVYAIRRIEWTSACYQEEHLCPPRTQFLLRAGIKDYCVAKWPRAQQTLDTALQALQQMTSDTDSVHGGSVP